MTITINFCTTRNWAALSVVKSALKLHGKLQVHKLKVLKLGEGLISGGIPAFIINLRRALIHLDLKEDQPAQRKYPHRICWRLVNWAKHCLVQTSWLGPSSLQYAAWVITGTRSQILRHSPVPALQCSQICICNFVQKYPQQCQPDILCWWHITYYMSALKTWRVLSWYCSGWSHISQPKWNNLRASLRHCKTPLIWYSSSPTTTSLHFWVLTALQHPPPLLLIPPTCPLKLTVLISQTDCSHVLPSVYTNVTYGNTLH